MIDLLFVALFQAAAADPAPQATPAPAANAQPVAAEEEAVPESVQRRRDRSRITCRDQANIGSRMSNRVCMSDIDREAQRRETQRIADEMHHSGALDGN